jgi:hypothetical protein
MVMADHPTPWARHEASGVGEKLAVAARAGPAPEIAAPKLATTRQATINVRSRRAPATDTDIHHSRANQVKWVTCTTFVAG